MAAASRFVWYFFIKEVSVIKLYELRILNDEDKGSIVNEQPILRETECMTIVAADNEDEARKFAQEKWGRVAKRSVSRHSDTLLLELFWEEKADCREYEGSEFHASQQTKKGVVYPKC